MFCGKGIGVISTQTNWILQPICNARHVRYGIRKPNDALQQAEEDMGKILWRDSGSVVKLGSKCKELKEGRKAVYDD